MNLTRDSAAPRPGGRNDIAVIRRAALESVGIACKAGDKAHSRYFSEDAYKAAAGPKELLIVLNADHVDLYDRADKIPFDRIADFFSRKL